MILNKSPITKEELQGATGFGVRILLMDSGVDLSHPALQGRHICTWDVALDSATPRIERDEGVDTFGHGTAVASILAEFAPAAQIDSLKVLGEDCRSSSQTVLVGLDWAIAQEYHVVNCSFSTPNSKYLPDYKTAVDRAFCRNVIVVSACNNSDCDRIEYPGSFPTVLSTDKGDLDGLTLRRRVGRLVEFVARGETIRVAWKGGQYRVGTGSSFAAPHVAALVARIRQLRPSWNACQIKAALYEFAASFELDP